MTRSTMERPTSPPPRTPDHEFLSAWLPWTDPDLQRMIQSFKDSSTPFTIGRRGDRAMMYAHRPRTIPASGKHREATTRWCCTA